MSSGAPTFPRENPHGKSERFQFASSSFIQCTSLGRLPSLPRDNWPLPPACLPLRCLQMIEAGPGRGCE